MMPFIRSMSTFFGEPTISAAERGAADRDEFRRVDQRTDMPAGHREAAQHGPDHDDATNDDNHSTATSKMANGARPRGNRPRRSAGRLLPRPLAPEQP